MHILALHAVMGMLCALRSSLSLELLKHYLLFVFTLLSNYPEATLRTPLSLICIRELGKKKYLSQIFLLIFFLSLVVGFGQLFVFIWVFKRMPCQDTQSLYFGHIYSGMRQPIISCFVLVLYCFVFKSQRGGRVKEKEGHKYV